ncbi:hypothetical protein [Desulfococcus sp.]|uniref:hypothetical protein n=1 Tax=Desulfococcus sp. TaxID=2025834 RepID=UPI003593B5B7
MKRKKEYYGIRKCYGISENYFLEQRGERLGGGSGRCPRRADFFYVVPPQLRPSYQALLKHPAQNEEYDTKSISFISD